jgi:hypothetical protein
MSKPRVSLASCLAASLLSLLTLAAPGCRQLKVDALRRPLQNEAFTLVKERFAPLFPGLNLIEPQVHWWHELCPGTTQTAVLIGSKCFAGLNKEPGAIEVAWRGSVGKSAYAHELMHYFLKQSGRDSDPDHLKAEIWAVVNQTDTLLQERGL